MTRRRVRSLTSGYPFKALLTVVGERPRVLESSFRFIAAMAFKAFWIFQQNTESKSYVKGKNFCIAALQLPHFVENLDF
jgi:hypothetical protein